MLILKRLVIFDEIFVFKNLGNVKSAKENKSREISELFLHLVYI